jgi:plasmid maintenance system killer protein
MKKSYKAKKIGKLKIRKKTKQIKSSFKKNASSKLLRLSQAEHFKDEKNKKAKPIEPEQTKRSKINYNPFEHCIHCIMLIFFPFVSIKFRD